jgi:hypothetical protein
MIAFAFWNAGERGENGLVESSSNPELSHDLDYVMPCVTRHRGLGRLRSPIMRGPGISRCGCPPRSL